MFSFENKWKIYSFISLKNIYIKIIFSFLMFFLNTVQINNKNIHLYQLYSPIKSINSWTYYSEIINYIQI